MMRKIENLPEPRKKWKIAVMLWCIQGDAAAKVGAKVVDSGRALKRDDMGKTKQKGMKGKKK